MEFKSLSKNCLKEWYIFRSILLIIVGGCFVGCLLIPAEEDEIILKTTFLIIIGMLLMWTIFYSLILPSMQYKRFKYRIDATRIEKKSGVIFLRQQFVPFVRIQYAEIYRGITDRIFNMATVIVYTAGSFVRIQNLDTEEAEKLVHHIRKILDNEARGDVND